MITSVGVDSKIREKYEEDTRKAIENDKIDKENIEELVRKCIEIFEKDIYYATCSECGEMISYSALDARPLHFERSVIGYVKCPYCDNIINGDEHILDKRFYKHK